GDGERFLAMSQTARDNFTDEQKAILSKDKTLLPFDITTIETVGGGSVRCMLGEIFLPRKYVVSPRHDNEVMAEPAVLA
ncbi:MAG TPA: arginine deiminase-related protein, partial [Candidatus Saccharimonadales bacterium]